jgi:hypothetical protein
MFNRDHLIYLAGIIDGEGSIGIDKQSPCKSRKTTYYAIRLLVVNTNVPLLDWLKENFKGNIIKRPKIENRRQCYVWSIFSCNAVNILKECLPFMIVKKRQAELLIEFMGLDKRGWNVPEDVQKRRIELYDELRHVNKTY